MGRVQMFAAALIAALVMTGGLAHAQRRAPDFALEGTGGATRHLRSYAGRVVILVYEDQNASHQNDALKDELARRARNDPALTREVTLLPIADLRGYDWWPARGYARDAVVSIAHEQNCEILIDWNGSVGQSYRLTAGQSHVIVVGRDGTMLFHGVGAMSAAQRVEFFRTVAEAMSAPATSAAQASAR